MTTPEPIKINGEVLNQFDFDRLAEIKPEDVSKAEKDFSKAMPKDFKKVIKPRD